MPTDRIVEGHLRFKEGFAADYEVYRELAEEGQSPAVLWIGCSDSRVDPERITGAAPGELFVTRNVANAVPPFGMSGDTVGAVIEFAVLDLEVSHIVVCGHTDCGGIKALEGHVDLVTEPHLARWLELARPARIQVEASGLPKDQRYLETVRVNALLQRRNLLTYRCVAGAVQSGSLQVHACLYDLHTGDLCAYDEGTEEWVALASSRVDPWRGAPL